MGFIERFSQKCLELYQNSSEEQYEGFEMKKSVKSASELLLMLLLLVCYILVVAFVGMFLWNKFLAGSGTGKGVVTVLKPLKDMPEAILVFLTLYLFFGGN